MAKPSEDKENQTEKHKYFKEQFDDEDVKLVFRKHPIVMRKGLVLAMVALMIGPLYTLALTYLRPEDSPTMGFFGLSLLASFVLGMLLLFPSWVKWYFSIYIMTDQRFIQQSRSMFQTNVVDISLEQVQMVNYQIVGIQETLMNFGTIIVQTYVGDLVIKEVHHPARIQKKMVHILRELGIHPTQKSSGQLFES